MTSSIITDLNQFTPINRNNIQRTKRNSKAQRSKKEFNKVETDLKVLYTWSKEESIFPRNEKETEEENLAKELEEVKTD